jgi:TonB family protein
MNTQFEGPGKNFKSQFKINSPVDTLSVNEPRPRRSPNAFFDYKLWKKLEAEINPQHTGRFLLSSILIHVLLVALALGASLQMVDDRQYETVEVQLMDPGVSTSTMAPLSATAVSPAVTETKAAAPEMKTSAQEPVTKEDIAVPAPIATPKLPEKLVEKPMPPPAKAIKPIAKVKPVAPAPVVKVAPLPDADEKLDSVKPETPASHASAPKPILIAPPKMQTFKSDSPVVLPESVDDIHAPVLDEAAATPVNPKDIDNDELHKDFAKVDHHQKKQIQAVAQELNAQGDQAAAEVNGEAEQLTAENAAESEKIAAFNASQRARDAQAIAAAAAAEKAAEARAAQERAEAQGAQERSDKEKSGAGGGNGTGTPEGVRDIGELRQRPGNPVPQYDAQERLQRQQGDVIFIAYVSSDGELSQFRMVQPSGFRNLDGKTLKALKKWRFFPGQEGWVEIPISWNIKGGAQEMPGLLKRQK